MLENKIDFAVLILADRCNPNGDPLWGNRPRTNYDGHGEISKECITRKIRNRLQDMGRPIFVQSNERCSDGCKSLSDRANTYLGKTKGKDKKTVAERACEMWIDVRSFGQVFSFKMDEKDDSVSLGLRGPVTLRMAESVAPVDVRSIQITKSVNGNTEAASKRGSDTVGSRHFVQHGLYVLKGSISPQLAEATGFSNSDANDIKEALRTLFSGDASAARPEGSMEVVKLYWWQHNDKHGQYSSAKVHRSLQVIVKDPAKIPSSLDDYDISLTELPGLVPEILEGE